MLLSTIPRQEPEESPEEPLSPMAELGLPELVCREGVEALPDLMCREGVEALPELELGLPGLEEGPTKVRRVTIERPPLLLQSVEATVWNWVEGFESPPKQEADEPPPKQEEPAPESSFDVDQFFN